MLEVIEKSAEAIANAKYVIAFTGAGVSQESGIPTFRDKGGLWERFPVDEFGTPDGLVSSFSRNPKLISEFVDGIIETIQKAKPNEGHIAVAELENMGFIKSVVTQNIDNLHQDAGSKNVIEVHGNITRMRCTSCDGRYKLTKEEFIGYAKKFSEEIKSGASLAQIINSLPKCECGGLLRPDVVLFTEPVQNLQSAFSEAERSDIVITAGTSGVVYPAAHIPYIAKRNAAKIIEINPTGQFFEADIYIKEKFAKALPEILKIIRKLKKDAGSLSAP